MDHRRAAVLFLALSQYPVAAGAAEICLVTRIQDGDTLTAQCQSSKIRVRLTEIDAPERTQPYSRQSTNNLKALCLHADASIEAAGLDRYGRTLARVTCRGVDANAEQVKQGLAWAFDRYLTDPTIKTHEAAARAARKGLWRSDAPVPPWEFRHPSTEPPETR